MTAARMQTEVSQRVFVHRYKDSHVARRKKYRRLEKDGKARVVRRDRDGWLYEVIA